MKIILAGIILGMVLVFSNIHVSDSYLQYNLLVTVKPKTTPIQDTDFPVIIGIITDEASLLSLDMLIIIWEIILRSTNF
jgi:hypothetical protein